ncbi:MAG: NAAT family transporter [Gammaproteobacteria bacterium]|nr:NAAT family transporter [Gammaproteobacteria bacterium]
MWDVLLSAFVTLFIVIDPIGVAWLFVALTRDVDNTIQRRMAARAVLLSGVMLLVFYFSGDILLKWMGITLPAFKIAGGILLILLAIDMVFARQSGLRSTTAGETHEAEHKKDISVFPLAFPMIAGPGALTTVLLMSGNAANSALLWYLVVILFAVLFITLLCLLYAPRLSRLLGETGANVISRLLGLILAALAVQFVIDGIKQSFHQ